MRPLKSQRVPVDAQREESIEARGNDLPGFQGLFRSSYSENRTEAQWNTIAIPTGAMPRFNDDSHRGRRTTGALHSIQFLNHNVRAHTAFVEMETQKTGLTDVDKNH